MMLNVTHKTPEIILALDVEKREQAEKILQATGNKLEWVKVGLQSYLRDGPDLVRTIADSGKKVFLDLKLHDIPNTMAKAMESLSTLPIGMLTLHAHAGEEALKRCAQTGKDILPETLAHDADAVRDGQVCVERRTRRALDAVVWPQGLVAVGHLGRIVRALTLV